jgi:molybdate transport system substrate-binding protein
MTTTVSLFSALAVKKALDDVLLETFTWEHEIDVDVTYDPTSVLLKRIEAGARPHVVIALTDSFPALAATGAIDLTSRVSIAKTGVGIAVAPDREAPDISTVDTLRAALTSARSVAYSRTGASGIYFAKLIEDLGVAAQVNSRATVVEKGFTALAVTDGRADLAVQQMSELKFVPQARIVGPLPEAVQHYSAMSVATGHPGKPEAVALLRFLSSPEAMAAYRDAGLTTDVPQPREASQ